MNPKYVDYVNRFQSQDYSTKPPLAQTRTLEDNSNLMNSP